MRRITVRALFLFSWLKGFAAQVGETECVWCGDGVAQPNFSDGPVDVLVIQAPLLSTNPRIGGKLGRLGAFHTAIAFAQGEVAFTLEFDATAKDNVFAAAFPIINGSSFIWDNDARFCLTPGLLHGRKHWSKTFEVVMTITAHQVRQTFADFVGPMNRTAHGMRPSYQIFKIMQRQRFLRPNGQVLIDDVTCGNGAMWFLNYVARTFHVELAKHFKLHYTSVFINVRELVPLNTSDEQVWADLVNEYRIILNVMNSALSPWQRVRDFFRGYPMKYMYSANEQKYYRLVGAEWPYLDVAFEEHSLEGPPFFATLTKPTLPKAVLNQSLSMSIIV